MLKEDVGLDYAVKVVKEEITKYKASLEKSRTKYKILEETEQPDGSVIMKIKKQYNKLLLALISTDTTEYQIKQRVAQSINPAYGSRCIF